ncbi:hypothetical protein [Limnofasciculus baicalensis]|uniref:Uncharacterized protein n=1 Tax=Limnofasciculus baicalensis BBK-W-15 TaxID=2699891 RepID=A0AAE3GRK6_9CYAN|nr:hypothetical protein [Limnofasciculus baicalensis]MCP2729440.1 hypothetical protein [Limnofasciculus baicalensis BBK-W-15]
MKTKLPLLKGYLPIIISGIILGQGLIAPAFSVPLEWLDKWPNKINYPTPKNEKPERRKIIDKSCVTSIKNYRKNQNDLNGKNLDEIEWINCDPVHPDKVIKSHPDIAKISCCFPPCDIENEGSHIQPQTREEDSSKPDPYELMLLMTETNKNPVA